MLSRTAVALVLLSLVGGSWGIEYVVTDPSDNVNVTTGCPGSSCTFRAAWSASSTGDTIVLNADPLMTAPITATVGTSRGSGVITVTGNGRVRIISPHPNMTEPVPLFSISNWPWGGSANVTLKLEFLTLQGFGKAVSRTGDGGAVVCLSLDTFCTDGTDLGEYDPKSPPKTAPRKDGEGAMAPTPVGDNGWGKLTPMLQLTRVVIRSNYLVVAGGEDVYWGGMVLLFCSHGTCPISVVDSQINNNFMLGEGNGYGMLILCTGYTGTMWCPIEIKHSIFSNNSATGAGVTDGGQGLGSLISSGAGPFLLRGSSFIENNVGSSCSIAAANSDSVNSKFGQQNMEVHNCVFYNNGASVSETAKEHAVLWASHLRLNNSEIQIPAGSACNTATFTPNDQYLENCYIAKKLGTTVLEGFQIFNRDPSYVRKIEAGTQVPGHLGFANCTVASQWFGCPTENEHKCVEVKNKHGQYVGYNCEYSG